MITFEHFEDGVTRLFVFLSNDFGYSAPDFRSTNRMYYARYYKGIPSIRVGYSLANNYIEVFYWPEEDNYNSAFLLPFMLIDKNTGFNYNSDYLTIMPDRLGFDESLKEVAALLKKNVVDLESFVTRRRKGI